MNTCNCRKVFKIQVTLTQTFDQYDSNEYDYQFCSFECMCNYFTRDFFDNDLYKFYEVTASIEIIGIKSKGIWLEQSDFINLCNFYRDGGLIDSDFIMLGKILLLNE
jgi:hypothetical protein